MPQKVKAAEPTHPRPTYDERRGSACKRGYGRRHEKWRQLVLHRDPACQIAVKCKGMTVSTVADHIVQVTEGGDWTMENGQGCCEACHQWKRAMEAQGKDWKRERDLLGVGGANFQGSRGRGPEPDNAHATAK